MTIPIDIYAYLKGKTRRNFRLEKAGLWNLQCYNLGNFDGRATISSWFVIVCFNPKRNIQTYVDGWKSSKEFFSENWTSRRKLMSQLNFIITLLLHQKITYLGELQNRFRIIDCYRWYNDRKYDRKVIQIFESKNFRCNIEENQVEVSKKNLRFFLFQKSTSPMAVFRPFFRIFG